MARASKVGRSRAKGGPTTKAGGFQTGNHSLNPDRTPGPGQRTKGTIKRLLMYKGGKAVRDSIGKIVKPAAFQGWHASGTVSRVAPNQKWFGNVRTVSQTALQKFQEDMKTTLSDPYKVVMKQTKLPVSLLNEKSKNSRVHVLDTCSYTSTFGPKSVRKRANVTASDLEGLRLASERRQDEYVSEADSNIVSKEEVRSLPPDEIMKKGQSKRIWGELYKVIDSSDVVVQVLDARDPLGTRSKHIETFMKKEKPHKHLILLLNKCDLIPVWAAKKWVSHLSEEFPTLAFYSSLRHPFGKGSLINLLRQFAKLHSERKQISVGFIGYPNVGKSSVINTLRSKKVCLTAPIAGQTKVWQYISLMKSIYLIDCPGVVYPTGETEFETVLKGVVRMENVKDAPEYIPHILQRVKKSEVAKTYKIDEEWTDHLDLLAKIAIRFGKLQKGGEPDFDTVSKMMLNDFHRGKLSYFLPPPDTSDGKKEKLMEDPEKAAPCVPNVEQDFSEMVAREDDDGDDDGRVVDSTENVEDDGTKEEGDAHPVTEASTESIDEDVTESSDLFSSQRSLKRKTEKAKKRQENQKSKFYAITDSKSRRKETVLQMSRKFRK